MLKFNETIKLPEIQSYCSNANTNPKTRDNKYNKFLKKEAKIILPKIEKEILYVAPEWADLNRIQNGNVCVHTIHVLYLTYINSDF